MSNLAKGRAPSADLITFNEVLDWLDIAASALRKMMRAKLLEPVTWHKGTHWFHTEDVRSARRYMRGRDNFDTMMRNSLLALSMAQRAERKVAALLEVLNVPTEPAEDPMAVYEAALRRVGTARSTPKSSATMRLWARRLGQFNQHSLRLVMNTYEGSHPWSTLLLVADELLLHNADQLDSPQMRAAWLMLQTGRDQLRREAYLACRAEYGRSAASRLVPDAAFDSINQTILSLL